MTIPTPSPNYRTGKICYLEIPAIDIAQSAQFYQQVFGWHIRQRNDGSTAFDDTTGEVSGTWVLGHSEHLPASRPGRDRGTASGSIIDEVIVLVQKTLTERGGIARRSVL